MNYYITMQEAQQLPAQGQAILANVDAFLDQVAAQGKRLRQFVLKDADYIYLENSLQQLRQRFVAGGQIDYNGVKLIRRV